MAANIATYTFVVARSQDHAIGQGNALPWSLPSDLRNFKSLTMGKPIVMGRRTYESIGRPLPGRPNIIISREGGKDQPGLFFVTSKEEAMTLAQSEARKLGANEVMIVGGAEIFNLFAREASKVHLTEVKTLIPTGDAHYRRDFSGPEWRVLRSYSMNAGCGDQYSYEVTTYERHVVANARKSNKCRQELALA